jgi:hypothetical protein
VYREDLLRALTQVGMRPFENLVAQAHEHWHIVEMRLETDATPGRRLAATYGRQRAKAFLPLIDPHISGPAVTLRLDAAALDQMLHTKGRGGDVSTWTLRLGKDADFIQFEPANPVRFEPLYSSLRWFYPLRSLD